VRLSAIAIAVVALSAFLPWASVLGFTKSGIRGDGVITMLLAVVGGLILALSTGLVGRERTPGKKSMIALLVLAALVAVIAVADMNGVTAIGLYLTLFAGIAWVVGAIWELNARRSGGTSVAAPGETTDLKMQVPLLCAQGDVAIPEFRSTGAVPSCARVKSCSVLLALSRCEREDVGPTGPGLTGSGGCPPTKQPGASPTGGRRATEAHLQLARDVLQQGVRRAHDHTNHQFTHAKCQRICDA